VIQEEFPLLPSAPALLRKTLSSLAPALQRLSPTHLAVPLFAPQSFTPGRGLSALLGFLTSQALPPHVHQKGLLHLFSSPSPLKLIGLSTNKPPNLGASSTCGLALSHRNGRRPVWPSSPTAIPILLKTVTVRRIIFSSRVPGALYKTPQNSLCLTTQLN
jgi:hypothetical protein